MRPHKNPTRYESSYKLKNQANIGDYGDDAAHRLRILSARDSATDSGEQTKQAASESPGYAGKPAVSSSVLFLPGEPCSKYDFSISHESGVFEGNSAGRAG